MIIDPRLVPKMAALDPTLMTGLPPHITAATGIDALTHAIESFVGHWTTAYSDGMALSAVGLIFENLRTAYRDGKNLEAREKMSLASTYAGFAFTRANVGYVHAIAHQFGGKYHTPHGLANAIMLPQVLKYSLPAITGRLALLAVRARVGDEGEDEDVLAQKFLDAVEQLNDDLGIPHHLEALREADIPALAQGGLRRRQHLPGAALHDAGGLRGADPPGAAAAHRGRPSRRQAKRAGKPAAAKKARARAAH